MTWTPSDGIELGSHDVHIWSLDLEALGAFESAFYRHLSDDERERAARLRVARKRIEYVVVRASLRACLATVLRAAPTDIVFRFAEHGKPALDASTEPLHFNVSHSHHRALIAITRRCELGIDIEKVREDIDTLALATRFFSPLEHQILASLPPSQQRNAFFDCWARKEAVIKCDGRGVSAGLDQFDVSLRPNEPARLLRTAWHPPDAFQWNLTALDVGSDYHAALAIRTQTFALRRWHFAGFA